MMLPPDNTAVLPGAICKTRMASNMPFIPLEFYTRLTYYACINILYKSKSPEPPCRINAKTIPP